MMRYLLAAILILFASPVLSDGPDIRAIIDDHVLPGYVALSQTTDHLAEVADQSCSPETPELIDAYHAAFDAWVSVSHLRFGPSEQDDRAFALAFWPDPRGSTPKALAALIRDQDAAVGNPEDFADVSIAARGFYALEFLLFDPQFTQDAGTDNYCALVRAVTGDISDNASAILSHWRSDYADLMAKPGNDTYRTQTEAAQQFFTALSTGLEFTSATRLGRPMGTFDRPRPNRAEARRSERSLRHVVLSLTATRELAAWISAGNEDVDEAFDTALKRADELDDPIFAGIANPQARFRVEVLQQEIDAIRDVLAEEVGPSLGIAAGFNALDGD